MRGPAVLFLLAAAPALAQGNDPAAINGCWVVDPGTPAASVVLTVGFDLDAGGRVIDGTMRLIRAEGGSPAAVEAAFAAARRAVIRCQGPAGYDLPGLAALAPFPVELTFDPTAEGGP